PHHALAPSDIAARDAFGLNRHAAADAKKKDRKFNFLILLASAAAWRFTPLRSALAVALAFSFAIGSSVARAAPAVRAAANDAAVEDLLHRGIELRKKGRDAEALDLFRQAYDLGKTPRAEAQVGLAEQALARWPQGANHLREALATADPWIQSHRAVLEEALRVAEQHLGRLQISGGVAGATVSLDGEKIGALPIDKPIPLAPGEHRITVEKEAYSTFSSRATVTAGQTVVLQVVLVSGSPILDDQMAVRSQPQRRSRRALWIGVGVGAAAVTLAVVLGVVLSHPTDYAANARSGCQAPCLVLEFK